MHGDLTIHLPLLQAPEPGDKGCHWLHALKLQKGTCCCKNCNPGLAKAFCGLTKLP